MPKPARMTRESQLQLDVLRLGLIGCGYWGYKLLGTLVHVPGCVVAATCDLNRAALKEASKLAPLARRYRDYSELLKDGGLDAVLVATPAVTHFPISVKCMMAGLDVLVEKPFAICVSDAHAMAQLAYRNRRILMAGHTYLYNPALVSLAALVHAGRIGAPRLIRSMRTHKGLIRGDVDVLWDLAPHDVSMVNRLFGCAPESVWASGTSIEGGARMDAAQINLSYPNDAKAEVFVSWLDPQRRRLLEILGVTGKAIFDDTRARRKLRVIESPHASHLQVRHAFPRDLKRTAGRVSYPSYGSGTPLERECEHFLYCVRERRQPMSGPASGLEVVGVLEAARRSLAAGGQPVAVVTAASEGLVTK